MFPLGFCLPLEPGGVKTSTKDAKWVFPLDFRSPLEPGGVKTSTKYARCFPWCSPSESLGRTCLVQQIQTDETST